MPENGTRTIQASLSDIFQNIFNWNGKFNMRSDNDEYNIVLFCVQSEKKEERKKREKNRKMKHGILMDIVWCSKNNEFKWIVVYFWNRKYIWIHFTISNPFQLELSFICSNSCSCSCSFFLSVSTHSSMHRKYTVSH